MTRGNTVPSNKNAKILQSMIHAIINGDFTIDEILPSENELSHKYAVSRTSMRFVLQRLENKGLITIVPKKGSIVNRSNKWNWLDKEILEQISPENIDKHYVKNIFITRSILEPNIAAIAAKFSTGSDLAKMEDAFNTMKKGAALGDRHYFNEGDINFHNAILHATHNPFLIALGHILTSAILISFHKTLDEEINANLPSLEEHRELMEYIRLRNGEAARQACERIIHNAIQRIIGEDITSELGINLHSVH